MKRWLRTVASAVAAMLVIVTGMIASSGTASAAVVVPPGAARHTCSEYHFVTPYHYWQTCAWADYRYVWFTVNFGNSDSGGWWPDVTMVDYIKSGVTKECPDGAWGGLYVGSNHVVSTPRSGCVITRVPGAYASIGEVLDGANEQQSVVMHSPTLQVQ